MIRYSSFSVTPWLYKTLLILNQFNLSFCFFTICYYYAHKGLSVDSTTKAELMKLMRYMIIITLPLFSVLCIWQIADLALKDTVSLCHTGFFVTPFFMDVVSSCFFLYICRRIAIYLKKISDKAQDSAYDDETYLTADVINKARKNALCNLRLVLVPILFNSVY